MRAKELLNLLEAESKYDMDKLLGAIKDISKTVEEDPEFKKQRLFDLAKRGDESILSNPLVDTITNKHNETPLDVLARKLGVNPFDLLDKVKISKVFSKPLTKKIDLD